jgi:hypothetical protein
MAQESHRKGKHQTQTSLLLLLSLPAARAVARILRSRPVLSRNPKESLSADYQDYYDFFSTQVQGSGFRGSDEQKKKSIIHRLTRLTGFLFFVF